MIAESVIIPNYNGEKYLKSCLESLKNQTMTDYELIIVDNASKDNWEKIVLSEYSTAKVIKLSQNHGFARAVNEGIRASSGEYVLLLNNDTCVDPEFIEKLYASIKEDNRIFSVGAKMVQMYDRELVDSAGDLYCALGWAFAIGKDKSIDKYIEEVCMINSIDPNHLKAGNYLIVPYYKPASFIIASRSLKSGISKPSGNPISSGIGDVSGAAVSAGSTGDSSTGASATVSSVSSTGSATASIGESTGSSAGISSAGASSTGVSSGTGTPSYLITRIETSSSISFDINLSKPSKVNCAIRCAG